MSKGKKLTQQDLASRLGGSDRTIGNWENGRNLCEELEISVNELLSGERLINKKFQEKMEDNIIKTIDYGNKIIIKNSTNDKIIKTIIDEKVVEKLIKLMRRA